MADPVTVRLKDEIMNKLKREAEEKKTTLPDVIRNRVRLSYEFENLVKLIDAADHANLEITNFRKWQEEYGAKILASRNLSWFSVILLCELIKQVSGNEGYSEAIRVVNEKFPSFLETNRLKL